MQKGEDRIVGYVDAADCYYCADCAAHAEEVSGATFDGVSGYALTVAGVREDKRRRESGELTFASPQFCEDCGEQIAPQEVYPRG